jgi:hypothetical protein
MAQPDFDQARFIAALTRHQPALELHDHAVRNRLVFMALPRYS